MSTVVKDLGAATAYGYAVEKGYTGTEEEFAELIASYATVGQTAVNAAQTATTKASEAATSAIIATNKASEATTAAQTASTKASEAGGCVETATQKATEATQSASQALGYKNDAESAKAASQTAQGLAESAKDSAISAKNDAVAAKTAAQTAQTGAETAAASVQSSAAQIQTNADDISELKEDTTQLKSALDYNELYTRLEHDIFINNGNGKWTYNEGYTILLAQVIPGQSVYAEGGANAAYYGFLIDDIIVRGQLANYAGGATNVTILYASETKTLTVPNDARFFYFTFGNSTTNRVPKILTMNGVNLLASVYGNMFATKAECNLYTDTSLYGVKYEYTIDGSSSYKTNLIIRKGHIYKITSTGIPVNINYMEQFGSTSRSLVTSVGGNSPYKTATAAYDGNVIAIASGSGNVSLTIKDITFETNIGKPIIVDANGNGDFTTLRDGVAEAEKYKNTIVVVNPGTYDLCTEFATEISANVANLRFGIGLKNGVHIKFMAGSKVLAKYTGNESNITTYFNPFYADGTGDGAFTLENLDIEASNTRYCVHDEMGGSEAGSRVVKYINCKMVFDNTSAPINYYPQCIGGGNGRHDYIVIDGCYFKSKKAESQQTTLVSYHNNGTTSFTTSQSEVHISNCCFADKGIFKCFYYGVSELISEAYLSNNSFGGAPIAEAVSGSTGPENYQIIQWLNEVRSE